MTKETGWLCLVTLEKPSGWGGENFFTKGIVYKEYDYNPLILIDDDLEQHEIEGEWLNYFKEQK